MCLCWIQENGKRQAWAYHVDWHQLPVFLEEETNCVLAVPNLQEMGAGARGSHAGVNSIHKAMIVEHIERPDNPSDVLVQIGVQPPICLGVTDQCNVSVGHAS